MHGYCIMSYILIRSRCTDTTDAPLDINTILNESEKYFSSQWDLKGQEYTDRGPHLMNLMLLIMTNLAFTRHLYLLTAPTNYLPYFSPTTSIP